MADMTLTKKPMDKDAYLEQVHKKKEAFLYAASDPLRLCYHIQPPIGWLNDPNGLCQKDGVYHIYHQYVPFYPKLCSVLWGHVTTRDFIHYQVQEPVNFPDTRWDANGTYSGSAFVKENTIYIYYTGNVRHTDKEYDYITDGREQNTILMTSEDGFHFSKKRLLMQNTDYPSDLSLHVRDPQVFCENGKYYMVQGARDLEARGSALLFESENLIDWSYRLRLEPEETFGYMWECPNYLSVDGRQFLIVCPQKMKQEKNRYIKENLCGYFPLQYDFLGEDYQIGAFATLDRGFDFYAPQVFKDEAGRWILLGWMSTPDASYDCEVTMEHGWVHAMTVPRELYVNQKGRLCQRPLEELQRMRTEGLTENFQTGSDFHKTVSACFEWKLTMDKPAEAFELLIRESAVLSYKDNVLCLDLTRCGAGRKTTEVLLPEVYELQILSDTSSLEIFVNGGEETFTTRIYDSMKGPQVAVKKMQGSGKLELYHLTV